MTKQKVTVGMMVFWRSLVTAALGAILWLQSTFMSKESFKQWEASNAVLRDTVSNNIDSRFDSVQIQLNRIESKLERVGNRRVELIQPTTPKAMGQLNINTNLYD